MQLILSLLLLVSQAGNSDPQESLETVNSKLLSECIAASTVFGSSPEMSWIERQAKKGLMNSEDVIRSSLEVPVELNWILTNYRSIPDITKEKTVIVTSKIPKSSFREINFKHGQFLQLIAKICSGVSCNCVFVRIETDEPTPIVMCTVVDYQLEKRFTETFSFDRKSLRWDKKKSSLKE